MLGRGAQNAYRTFSGNNAWSPYLKYRVYYATVGFGTAAAANPI
jgi:hypothetical protein